MEDLNLFELIIAIIALPLQLARMIIWEVLDTITFDILGLGTYLPIRL